MSGNRKIESRQPPQVVRGVRRVVYLAAAAAFFVLGIIGILLPGLPTTPFLLLTSYFLVRSSPVLNERMLRSRLLGPLLRDWIGQRAVRRAIKFRAVLVVVAVLLATTLFGNLPARLLAIVLSLGAVGLLVILRLPTIPEDRAATAEEFAESTI